MKLAKLVVGAEYAVHRYGTAKADYLTPRRARLVAIEESRDRSNQRLRLARVELLEESDWASKGVRLLLPARCIWRPWPEQEQVNALKLAEQEQVNANTEAMRKALGVLGLHDNRYHRVSVDPGKYTVTLSALELTKLADAVVEIERLVYKWWREGEGVPDGDVRWAAAEDLYAWAQAHDFGNITE